MLKVIVLLALVANLNVVLTANSPQDVSVNESCNKKECGPNQVYEVCPSTCPPRTCKTKDIAFRCKEPLKPGNPDCPPPGCRCAANYYSNDEGKCVLKEQCPGCKVNEEYSECPNKVCREKTCNDLGFPLPCYNLDSNNVSCGKPRCICKQRFVRDCNGVCIPKRDCPSCGGDPNAWSGCGTFCNRCTKNVPCPRICRVNACDCRTGYVYDSNKKRCVKPEQCPCGRNEVPSTCANNPCSINTCKQKDLCIKCKPNLANCKPGCVCAPGYLKDDNSNCIPKHKCPRNCGPLEVYSDCANAGCDKRNCSQVNQPALCIDVSEGGCVGDCVCKPDYLRTAAGICVPVSDCPSNTNSSTTTPGSGSNSNAIDKFNQGNLKFTANFFYNVVLENPNKSVVMSAYSTLFLLAVLALRAQGETAQQLFNAINLKDENEIRSAIPAIIDSIFEQKNITLSIAARVYGNIRSNFSETFKAETKEILRAESENLDFSDPEKAAAIINKWVAEQTNNKITDLVPANLLTPETELVLTNALYCLSEWKYKFEPELTTPSDFYLADNSTITVDTMNQVKYFNYAEIDELNAKALELPYVNDNLTCLIILPNNNNGATTLVSKLVDVNALNSVKSSLQSARVSVSLPKFKTTTTTDLKVIFQKLNITAMFDPELSRLEGILADPRTLYVSAGIQKADIEVNEIGSEAAAGNVIIAVGGSAMPEPPKPFIADHSFVYYLMFQGFPIFCGLFAGN